MTNKEAIEVIGQFSRIVNNESWLPEAQKAIKEASDLAIKALEVVEKIKKAYVTSYKCFLNNLENGFTEEMATPVFYHDVAFSINNILCDAYDTEEMMSWLKEVEKDEQITNNN